MAQGSANPEGQGKPRWWGAWAAVALVATLGGLFLPQLMPGDAVMQKTAMNEKAKDKKKIEYAAPAVPEVPHFQGMLLRLGTGTIVVLGLCVGTLWGMKRWMHPQTLTNAVDREMRLKETLNLGNRCTLHLVHLGKREVLIGVDATGIKAVVQLPAGFDETLAEAQTIALPEESKPRLAA